jgi:ABC-2 type transport system ATP-binding protein
MANAIETEGLTRFYGKNRGVREMNWVVPEGSIFGLLGENGCGKTTALKLAMGMLVPDCGSVRTLGIDPVDMPPAVRARIGWMSDALAVPSRMTLWDAMGLQAAYYPTWDDTLAHELAERFDLGESSVFGQLSLGQKRRFMLMLILAQVPDLLVLDEPAGGLDVVVRRELIEILIEQAAKRPLTIVLSSHILTDVERLVDRGAVFHEGDAIEADELETLRARVKRLCPASSREAEAIRSRFRVRSESKSGGERLLVVEDFDPARLEGIEATVEHLNLEELFLVFTQTEEEEAEL